MTKPANSPEGEEARRPPSPSAHREAHDQPVDKTIVSDDALATLIGLAAHEVPGVVGMAPAGLGEGIRRVLGVSQADEGVEIGWPDEGSQPDVTLHIVVAYGVNIPVVAESVEQRVRYAALHFGGTPVRKVKIRVAGVSRD